MAFTSRSQNLALFVTLAIAWGSLFAAVKIGLEYFPPILFAALRNDIAAILLFTFVFFKAERTRPKGRSEWFDVIVGGLFVVAGFQAFLYLGEQTTPSAIASIIVSMNPIFVTGFSRLILPDERLTKLGLVGLFTGFVGVGIVIRPSPALLLSGELLGEFLILIAVVSFGFGAILTRVVAEDIHLPVTVRIAWIMAIAAIAQHVTSVLLSEPITSVQLTGVGLGALVYLALVSSILGYFIYFELLNRIGAIEANLISYASPIVATLLAWVLLGERLAFITVSGFLVIFAGFVMIKSGELTERIHRLIG